MKKKFPIGLLIVLIILVGFSLRIFYNKNKDFGLPNDVKNIEKQLSAEETIRLHFYYSNRKDERVDDIIDTTILDDGIRVLDSVNLFEDIYLIDIKELSTEDQPNEWGVYQIKTYQVKFNCGVFIASKSENENTIDVDFILVKKEEDSPWKIVGIGNG